MADALEVKLAKDQWLGGQQPSSADREAIESMPVPPSPATHPNVFGWWCMVSKFVPAVRATWPGAKAEAPKADAKKGGKKEEPKKEEAKPAAADEDEFDPFADEPEDEEAERAKQERFKEIAKTAKSYGKVVVAKSLIIWEVKPWGEETNLDELAKKILQIEQDGLQWKTEYKKEPIAYGIFKLVIGATIEDLKVSTDEIQEKIEAFEEEVQSVDIAAFNKL